jgi:hypothetical protein
MLDWTQPDCHLGSRWLDEVARIVKLATVSCVTENAYILHMKLTEI